MSKKLTKRQKEILDFIEGFIDEHSYPPTLKEIADEFKITSKGSYDHVVALKKKNYLTYETGKRRSIKLLYTSNSEKPVSKNGFFEIPVLGTVQAGDPILSYENYEESIKVSTGMFGTGDLFGLKVRGDSMIDAGIVEGDVAVVKRAEHFENGEIIVANTADGVTIKKGYKDSDHLRLEPANEAYSPIIEHNPRIIGKLVGIIRRY